MSERFDVFVSHASEDKAGFVDPLVSALHNLGLTVWYDRQHIRLGDHFRRRMDDGLKKADLAVVVLSPSFLF